jgi:hypothetical protein
VGERIKTHSSNARTESLVSLVIEGWVEICSFYATEKGKADKQASASPIRVLSAATPPKKAGKTNQR